MPEELNSRLLQKADFFVRLHDNLADVDPAQEDRLVDAFRALILGQSIVNPNGSRSPADGQPRK